MVPCRNFGKSRLEGTRVRRGWGDTWLSYFSPLPSPSSACQHQMATCPSTCSCKRTPQSKHLDWWEAGFCWNPEHLKNNLFRYRKPAVGSQPSQIPRYNHGLGGLGFSRPKTLRAGNLLRNVTFVEVDRFTCLHQGLVNAVGFCA